MLLGDYQRAYQRHLKVRAELDELTSRARERAAEADDLRRGLAEIERLEPADGEDLDLHAEAERLTNADTLHSAATTAHEALISDPTTATFDSADVLTLLGSAKQALEAAAPHDPALGVLSARLSEATYLISDVAAELASYADSVEADPGRLAVVQDRRAELTRLIRLYGAAPVPQPANETTEAAAAGSELAAGPLTETSAADDPAPAKPHQLYLTWRPC